MTTVKTDGEEKSILRGESQEQVREKGARAGKAESLQQKLAKLEKDAELIRQKIQDQRRKEREANLRLISVLVQKEELSEFPIETWRAALPRIREALSSFAGTP